MPPVLGQFRMVLASAQVGRARPGLRRAGRAAPVALAAALFVPSVAIGVLAPSPAGADTSCLTGNGTADIPFEVGSADDLAEVGKGANGCTLTAFYRQTANITLVAPAEGESNHTRIGEGISGVGGFEGTYDGGGFTISGLVMNQTSAGRAGFFGRTLNATVKNVHIINGKVRHDTISSEGPENDAVGRLIGLSEASQVSQSSFSGAVESTSGGADSIGGLIGLAFTGSVTTSFATGTVKTNAGLSTGGLIGQVLSVSVSDSYSTSTVSGNNRIGGLIGVYLTEPVNLQRVYATGSVTTTGTDKGGLIGMAERTGAFTGTVLDSFWDSQTTGLATNAAGIIGGTAKTTSEMKAFATFSDTATDGLTTSWKIVDGWESFVAGEKVWGICEGVNSGYPFLLWQFTSNPCVASASATSSSSSTSAAPPSVSCGPLPLFVGSEVVCTVTGGVLGVDILWRAAYNPPFASEGVAIGADGTGTFSFVVPAAALGQELTVELVDWAAPVPIGVVGGPVPSSVPAGGGPVAVGVLGFLLLAWVVVLRRRSPAWPGLRTVQ